MKYTPEELLEYVKQEHFELDFSNALYNNNVGFCSLFVPARLSKNLYEIEITLQDDVEPMKIVVDKEKYNEFSKMPNNLAALLIMKENEDVINSKIILILLDNPIKDCFELTEEEELYIERRKGIAFLEAAGADTHGKVKKLLRDSYEIYKNYMGIENEFQYMRDELLIQN